MEKKLVYRYKGSLWVYSHSTLPKLSFWDKVKQLFGRYAATETEVVVNKKADKPTTITFYKKGFPHDRLHMTFPYFYQQIFTGQMVADEIEL